MYENHVKRWIDFTLSSIGFVITLPLLLIMILIILLIYKENPFFTQRRPGKNGKIFHIIKIRTMNNAKDEDGNLLSDSERLTSFGKFIRRYSLDEIPQLINVIKGEMSLVGPRPQLEEFLELYTDEQLKRQNVRPGITGWAQINGRNTITWTKRFELDVWYVENISFKLDAKITLTTLMIVLKGEGVDAGENITMERFNGYN